MPHNRFQPIVLAVMLAGSVALQAEGIRGRPIEFSEPPSERGRTEDRVLPPGQSRLGQWENELNRPFQGLTPGKSLDGMILSTPLPLPPPAVSTPQSRELSNRRKDWMFLTPEEVFGINSAEDKFKAPALTPDGRNRDTIRPMERAYLEAAEAARAAFTNQGQPNPTSGNTFQLGTGSTLPGATTSGSISPGGQMNDGSLGLPNNMGWGSSFGRPANTDAADFFKFNSGYKPPTKPTDAQIQRAQEFRQIYDFSNTQSEPAATRSDYIYTSPYVDKSFFDFSRPAAPAPVTAASGGFSGNSTAAGSATEWTPPPRQAPEPSRITGPAPSPFMAIPRRNY